MSSAAFRQLNRVSVCLPVRVTVRTLPVREAPCVWRMNLQCEDTLTENISSGGCYFFLTQEPPLGSLLDMEVTIPGDILDVPFARIYCRGKVVRVDQEPAKHDSEQTRFGVAAIIERLQDVSVESIPPPAEHTKGAVIA